MTIALNKFTRYITHIYILKYLIFITKDFEFFEILFFQDFVTDEFHA